MADLNQALFAKDIKGEVNTFRQNLQLTYTQRLIEMVNGKTASRFNNMAQSMALYNLNQILDWVKKPKGGISSVAHKTHLSKLIENALNEVK